MLLPTPCHVDHPSARPACDLNPTPGRTGQTAPVRTHPTGPGRPRLAPRTPLPSALPFFPRETPRLHTYDAPPLPAPATRHRRAPISGVDTAASGDPPPALLGPPPEPLRPPRRASWAPPGSPAPNPNPSSRRGAVQVRPLLHRALRPASLCPPRPLRVAIEVRRVPRGGVGGRSEWPLRGDCAGGC
ncbi:hypothetical protein GQ55_5G271100 [Panicum hallii var. hallii]|uniref:Uncharacterized protein n=1 Tax=Panicum hallii var. hallii TaxID=1504633 RepID=A0A2T7DKP2_9POAL|nr:hypothetical protein GQ55_5G271100 [Panicum hallii var. hallii]